MAASDLELGYAGAKIYAGFRAGARFVVLLHPDRASASLDARLREALADRLRPVARQRLAEIYEVPRG
jgi:hypothetical protein